MDPQSYITSLEEIAKVGHTHPQYRLLEEFPTREDAINLVPIIFANSTDPILRNTCIRALHHFVTTKWDSVPAQNKMQIRCFALQIKQHFGIPTIDKVITAIAIRDYPTVWPDFLDMVLAPPEPQFDLFADYLSNFRSACDISPSQRVVEQATIMNNLHRIIPMILQFYSVTPSAANALVELIPFLTHDALQIIINSDLLSSEQPDFRTIFELMFAPTIDDQMLRSIFGSTVNFLDVSEINEFSYHLSALLTQSMEVLEDESTLPVLIKANELLIQSDFIDILEYWESLLMTLVDSPQRVPLYAQFFPMLCQHCLHCRLMPSDFYLKDIAEFHKSATATSSLRTIIVCLLKLCPDLLMGMIREGFEQCNAALQNPDAGISFNQDQFIILVLVSSVAAVAIPPEFACQTVSFARGVHLTQKNPTVTGTCLFYMANTYVQLERISPELTSEIGRMAIESLSVVSLQRISITCLLSIARAIPAVLVPHVNANQLLSSNELPPEYFTQIAEVVARVCNVGGTFDSVVATVNQRWSALLAIGLGPEQSQELKMVLGALTGVANVGPIDPIIAQIIEPLKGISTTYLQTIYALAQEIGTELVVRRDDVKNISCCYQYIAQLLSASKFADSMFLIELYNALPPQLRPSAFISLATTLLMIGAPPPVMHAAIVVPTEQMIYSEPEQFSVHAYDLCELISVIAKADLNLITPDDVATIISFVKRPTLISPALNTVEVFFEAASNGVGVILVTDFTAALIEAAPNPLNRHALLQILSLLETGINIIRSLPEQNTKMEMIQRLTGQLCETFTIVPQDEMGRSCLELVEAVDNFEDAFVNMIITAHQVNSKEIKRHLYFQKIHAGIFQ